MHPAEVRQCKGALRGTDEERSSFVHGSHALAGKIVIAQKSAGVGITLQRLAEEDGIQLAAVSAPVSVMETAGEGGPYGMALLCAYMLWRRKGESLEEYLDNRVFADAGVSTVLPDSVDAAGFTSFLERYKAAFPLERLAVETLRMEKNT